MTIGGDSGLKAGRGLLGAVFALAALGQLGCARVLGDFDLGAGHDSGLVSIPDAGPPDEGPIVDATPPPPDGACVVGMKQCQGATLFSCRGTGDWVGEVTCPSLCDSGACVGMCKPGAKTCDGMASKTCKMDGTWETPVVCSFGCADGVCGVCVQGAKRCTGMTGQQVMQTCDSTGNWKDTMKCPFACAVDTCSGMCVPATRQCSGNH